MVEERGDRRDPEARLDQGDALDHQVRMGHQVLVVRIHPQGDRGLMVRIAPFEQREEGARIHHDAHHGPSPISSSWRSEMSLRPERTHRAQAKIEDAPPGERAS
jgi:hypothetical protein